jgi:hypothetical protein
MNRDAGLRESADKLPGAAEDAGFFGVENGGVSVELRGEGVSEFDLVVNIEIEAMIGHGKKGADGSLLLNIENR